VTRVVHTRREALKRGLALIGAAGTGVLLFDAAPAGADTGDGGSASGQIGASSPGGDGAQGSAGDDGRRAPQVFTGAGLDVSAPDFVGGTLPAAGQRLLVAGALLDATGAAVGQVVGTYTQLVPFGQAGPGDAVSLLEEVLTVNDGTIWGRGVVIGDIGSPVTFAVTGGTGRYAGLTGTWTGAQQFLSLGGDGSAQFTFTTTAEGSDHGAG
jgi:hypothetical protein